MFIHVPTREHRALLWVTPLLVVVCTAAFFWLTTLDPEPRALVLRRWGAVPETLFPNGVAWQALLEGRPLTLVSALFIHVDWLHLVGNLLFLVIFGVRGERALGPWRFLLLFVIGGGLANLSAVLLVDVPYSVVVGASGAVSTLIGAYLALFPRARLGFVVPLGLFLEFVRTPASLMIGLWAALQLIFTFVGPAFGAVAWSAHLCGFVLGASYGLVARPAVVRRMRGQHQGV
jgi:membrane associated rhomboid family serine protease